MGILLAIILVVHFITTALTRRFALQTVHTDDQVLSQQVVPAVASSRIYFPLPHEQVSPRMDLQAFRAQEEAELNSYGWIDRKAGIVRIPIDQAIALISRQGLAVRSGASGDKTGPSSLKLQQQRPLQFTPSGKEEKQ